MVLVVSRPGHRLYSIFFSTVPVPGVNIYLSNDV